MHRHMSSPVGEGRGGHRTDETADGSQRNLTGRPEGTNLYVDILFERGVDCRCYMRTRLSFDEWLNRELDVYHTA